MNRSIVLTPTNEYWYFLQTADTIYITCLLSVTFAPGLPATLPTSLAGTPQQGYYQPRVLIYFWHRCPKRQYGLSVQSPICCTPCISTECFQSTRRLRNSLHY